MKPIKFPFEVYATAFHGGRFISRHSTMELAEKAVKRYRVSDCICGCAGIIDATSEKPGTMADQAEWSNPYSIGAI